MAATESGTPRHGRHSAAGRHSAPRQQVQEPVTPEVAEPLSSPDEGSERVGRRFATPVSEVRPIIDGDQETSMGDAPRPIGVDPAETGSFQRITSEEGARVTTRANASETASFRLENARPMEAVRMSSAGRPHVSRHEVEVKSNRRVFAILGIAAAVMLVLVGTLVTRALLSVEKGQEKTVAEQAQASGDEGIEYRGTTYTLTKQNNGKYALTSTSEGSEGKAVVCELEGTPVTLILYNTVFVIPENLSDGTWDLIAHPLGGGSVTQQVTDADGKAVTGEGEISEAKLAGDAVEVVTTNGARTKVSLV